MPGAYRDIYSGLVRLHVLHHANIAPIYGLEMLTELRRHGYRLGPGTLYPLLHSMEKRGLLRLLRTSTAGKGRRLYRATPAGRRALKEAREKVRELFTELTENEA